MEDKTLYYDVFLNGKEEKTGKELISRCADCGGALFDLKQQAIHKDIHPSQVLPKLYLGAAAHSMRKDLLLDMGIKYILNVASEATPYHPKDFEYLHLKLEDTTEQPIRIYFQQAFPFINRALERGHGVLVHCLMGISRSATMVIGYIMTSQKMSYKDSHQFVVDRRPIIWPNPGFVRQLEEYEKELGNTTSSSSSSFL